MIDITATLEEFGYEDCGLNKPCIATCPICKRNRRTQKANADNMCISCAHTHQDHVFTKAFKATHAGASV